MGDKVLLLSHGKSGTLLACSIAKAIQDEHGVYRSYKQAVGIDAILQALCSTYVHEPLSYYIDHLESTQKGPVLAFHHPRLQAIPVDVNILDQASSLIVSHTPPAILLKKYNRLQNRTIIYIYRDGRDVINSWFYYVTQPTILKKNPQYKHSTLRSLLLDYDLFVQQVSKWVEHIRSAKSLSEHVYFLSFEEMVQHKTDAVLKIARHMGLDCNIYDIIEQTSLSKMKAYAPEHVRTGKYGGWKDTFDDKHRDIFKKLAGDMLIQLGYERNLNW